ncbi:hypothetical protein AS034_05135 [[Bacillus] enclensis]|uniref:Uncharacterized protein n=1 Tax=[Bacillus] enclensis TaxID=1402860 RepID=A0A0V8HN96_9BACI|nr:hypothetical protein [[Bacillus] enclensis]KSU63633.1 hypothetical protein AS034_05135 [[Bacillus] enclensis]SCB87246.1 hypothetical protein GA0061094_1071 [[Bacillus] enclensis]
MRKVFKKGILATIVALAVSSTLGLSQASAALDTLGYHYLYLNNASEHWNYADWDYQTYQQAGKTFALNSGEDFGVKIGFDPTTISYPAYNDNPYGTYQPIVEIMLYEYDGNNNYTYIGKKVINAADMYRNWDNGTVWFDSSVFSSVASGENGAMEIDVRYTYNFSALDDSSYSTKTHVSIWSR